MTDLSSPITGPLPSPMFDSGPQPASSPNTEPNPAPIFDTGPNPGPLQPRTGAVRSPEDSVEAETGNAEASPVPVTGHLPIAVPAAAPAHPVTLPGTHQFVARWKFALIVVGVWVLAAAAGAGFYYWWYTALAKTLPVLGILVFVGACAVASLLVSMVPNRPQLSALAVALMAAPLAATAAAAVLHGAYFFEWIARPVIG